MPHEPSEAARPYARSSFDNILKQAKACPEQSEGSGVGGTRSTRQIIPLGNADADIAACAELYEASDAYWEKFLPVKPRILTTVHDNASLRVRGGALIVYDGEHKTVYEAGARKPQAIVMTGMGRPCHSRSHAVCLWP